MIGEVFHLDELVPKPFPSEKWLSRRLNAGIIPGSKVGRKWVMTKQDVLQALEQLKNNTNNQPTTTTAAVPRRRRAS